MYTDYVTQILRDDGAWIPFDPLNPDCIAYLLWLSEGNTPRPMPQPSHSELVEIAKAATRIQRQPVISILDGLQPSSLVKGETARALLIETAKQGLRDITNTDLSACTTYEEMRLKVKAAYIALAVALPADIRLAFSEAVS